MKTEIESSADVRRRQVAQAAVGVFLRYGLARTTMGDIAKAAGLTRPTLYQSFADKNAVFAAVMAVMAAEMFGKLRGGLDDHADLEAKLRYACDVWGVGGLEVLLAHPNAEDMFDLSYEPVQKIYAEFERVVAEVLREPLQESGLAVSAEELAHVISFGIKGFKSVTRDAASLRRMIEVQVGVVVAALQAAPAGAKTARAKPAPRTRRAKR